MALHLVDWLVVGAYVAFAIAVGLAFARRAGKNLDEYFLSGRSLPWWVAGTSMVATSFAIDTPLLISGWVRDDGVWKNWFWWCFAIAGVIQVFTFARWWRRGEVMTKAELAELRYGGQGARVLRFSLGLLHAGFINTFTLCWVMLAAGKVFDVLFGVELWLGCGVAGIIALVYCLLAGFWGVVLTDLVQFVMAMIGAVSLAWFAWSHIDGAAGLRAAVDSGLFDIERLQLFPSPGSGGFWEGSFWTASWTALCVYFGVQWWAAENVDGTGTAIQRISAARDERQGLLAVLWFNFAHYALRPWPWILVGLASLLVLPTIELHARGPGEVVAVQKDSLTVRLESGGEEVLSLLGEDGAGDWRAEPSGLEPGSSFEAGELLARTDAEKAYVVMMTRFLPVGLLGLVVASLLAAFMSTVDTHVNLATSFFVNDLYRRFVAPDREPHHYVQVARLASVVVLAVAFVFASLADSIRELFALFLAFLGGVGPVYVMRWLWWRIRPVQEIAGMTTSAGVTIGLWIANKAGVDLPFTLGPLTADGAFTAEGRILCVAAASLSVVGLTLLLGGRPDPGSLVTFYRKVRPLGWWGPVRELCGVGPVPGEGRWALTGIASSLLATYGTMLGLGFLLLGRSWPGALWLAAAVFGARMTFVALRNLRSAVG